MKHLSRTDIERIGEHILYAYRQLPEVSSEQFYRVQPELLIERLLSLSLSYCHLSVDGSILGVTAYEPIELQIYDENDEHMYYHMNGKTILVEKDLRDSVRQRGRCNFTLAHEASHHILNMMFPSKIASKGYRTVLHYYKPQSETRKPIQNWEEWQANTLAAAILLPVDLVYRTLSMFCLPDKIEMIDKQFSPDIYEHFSDAALFLGVSKTAFAIRLKHLGILKQDYLSNRHDVFSTVRYEEVSGIWPK